MSNKQQEIVEKALAQSGALAVQDAANTMRDMNTLLSTAAGVALANFIESGDSKYLDALNGLNEHEKLSKREFVDLYNSVTKTEVGK